MQPFFPLVRNPHALTIFGNFARRRLDEARFPVESKLYTTEPGVQVLVHTQRPDLPARGEVVMLHGLEGSSSAGYMRSMAQLALESGYAVHRTNMRSCGGTESLCKTMYHAGLTADTLSIIQQIRDRQTAPIYLIGYSLGGNVALKLAGELGDQAVGILAGVCAVSTPVDLGACVRAMGRRRNRIYEWRFVSRLKERIRTRAASLPGVYPLHLLDKIHTVYEFDDKITAPYFGFGTADNYYATQSSNQFVEHIRIPALLVQAKDDPLIPFEVFNHPGILTNPNVRLIAVEHGGHLGFLSNRAPRFWVDRVIVQWLSETGSN
ncbi:MAG TPA: alpha/beta fold hydrolase [Bryobacteraceae bacterium]|nr:alpha/beta fold hydrolase [Bryobacteraceae bacterium]